MSVMSAAEARQAAGTSPEIPPQPLRVVRPAAGQDDAAEAGDMLDSGGRTSAEPGVAGCGATTLRVTQVRTVREVRVRMLRAEGTRAGTVRPPRAEGPAAATAPPRVPVLGEPASSAGPTTPGDRMTARARAAMQAQVAAQVRVSDQAGPASEAHVTRQARMTSQVRVAQEASVARHARVPGQDQVARQTRVAPRPSPVRLTRRGRRLVAALVIGVVIVAVTVLWMSVAGSVQASSHGSAQGSPYQGMTQVVVRPGQTLWSIAAAAEPSGNLWAVVQQIINVNALSSASVQAGQLLWVPRN
jgi:nucleoid-associated protein YgaU